METNGIILAAGLSSRMGEFKPLLKFKGKTMIEYSIDSMFNAGVSRVIVVLGYRGQEVEALLRNNYDSLHLLVVFNENYKETDMLASVKIGISALNTCDAFYILPGDMPAISTKTFLLVNDAMSKTNAMVVFPTINGHLKHPPLISWRCIEYIHNFVGEGGLRELWKHFGNQIATIPVQDRGCIMDADTVEDYNKLANYMESLIQF
ncbi:nucleotidyltransferase family protein [Clostridium bowmanii]|uniref:nucleotidyltransferase family protein n=1 Tax=Clostridium bowmanii TaxID=132925 RepID=UPI001C0B75E1|nr:nucleotidyltransferase family protein [Clostridium bowmanii]MBU3189510.1 nucleotidyltransferase family protein [Clostridium bowmanii]MCA1074125.1 nucleotidyltransferase family protein [Clostridium bowmanii]